MSSSFVHPVDVSDPDWVEFESLLNELARLAKADIAFEQFAGALLDQTVHMLAAIGGCVWIGQERLCQLNFQSIEGNSDHDFHTELIRQVQASGEVVAIAPGGATMDSLVLPNPTEYTLLFGPLKIDHEIVGLVEIVQRPSVSSAALRGNRRLLALVCELAADNLRRQELRKLRSEQVRAEQFDQFLAKIHGSLDARTVSYQLANLGRQLLDCDRVSVAIRRGRKFELMAVSGVDAVNRRSNAARRLERLAACAARGRELIWYDGENDQQFAPQLLEALHEYADEIHPRSIGLVALVDGAGPEGLAAGSVFGVLIVEQFNSVLADTARERAVRVAQHGSNALANALRHEMLPTLPFIRSASRTLGQPAIRRSTWLAVSGAIAGIAALLFVPIEFNIQASGELQPAEFQHVFAPFEAQVTSIHVRHGAEVAAGDLLLTLRSEALDLERQRIQGEFDVTQKRIVTIESTLLDADRRENRDDNRTNALVAEREELLQLLASQREQLSLLSEQQKKLEVRSPIGGQVLTWNLDRLLADRPVQRGQQLLSIADLRGEWTAELKIPDEQIGHVLRYQDEPHVLRASFQLATNRGVDHKGQIRRIAARTEAADNRPIVRAVMDVQEDVVQELRPGATIFAEIHCGKRSAGFVLFHELFEKVISWLRF